ncbi:MAG: serine/threonine-protein kinase [Bryobacteraceae bacterium]|nr:serine/threonine-protein kinase [Bryobacteraceae bacterium]
MALRPGLAAGPVGLHVTSGSPERHQRIGELFDAALGQPAPSRATFLRAACGDDLELLTAVQRLLENDLETDTFLDPILARKDVIAALSEPGPGAPSPAPPATIGSYHLERPLGEGGMGTVYLATQTHPIRRQVALKVIKPGMDSKQVIARFESERRALALMSHPNVAQVFDAGATGHGLPYFVMELVDGVPINQYCLSKQLKIRERIELFIPVCQAIQHAHQKGIIHRDIKPSNVLVSVVEGKPVPKVIDFGLAKALGSELTDATMLTGLGAVVGTLQYMSPEQAEPGAAADIDTRSDVYSLGALLYELLTGTPPLDAKRIAKENYLGILKRIREEEPQTPSARLKESGQFPPLDSELDWIPMKALEKERFRRYETVNDLVRDLTRYLAGEPVDAAPPSATYRMGKFARRHRTWLTVAAAFLVLLLIGSGLVGWLALRATRAEQEARAINEFLLNDLLGQADPSAQAAGSRADAQLTVRAALDRAAARIGGRFGDQPNLEGAIRHTIGSAYWGLGLFPQATSQLESAVKLRSLAGRETEGALESKANLGGVYWQAGRNAEAEPLLRQALADQTRTLGRAHRQTLATRTRLGNVLDTMGKIKEAEALWIEGEAIARATYGPDDLLSLGYAMSLGGHYFVNGDDEKAQALLLTPFEKYRRRFGDDHPKTVEATTSLALAYTSMGRLDLALPLYEKSLEVDRRLYGPAHPGTLVSMYNLAVTLSSLGQRERAEALYAENYANRVKIYPPDHPRTLLFLDTRAANFTLMGQYDRAEAIYAQLLPLARQKLGDTHSTTQSAWQGLSDLRRRQGRLAEAETLQREQLKALSSSDASAARMAGRYLAEILLLQKKYAEAEPLARQAAAEGASLKLNTWDRWYAQSLLGAILMEQSRYAGAEPELVSGYEGLLRLKPKMISDDRESFLNAGQWLVEVYERQGKSAKAAEWARKIRQ